MQLESSKLPVKSNARITDFLKISTRGILPQTIVLELSAENGAKYPLVVGRNWINCSRRFSPPCSPLLALRRLIRMPPFIISACVQSLRWRFNTAPTLAEHRRCFITRLRRDDGIIKEQEWPSMERERRMEESREREVEKMENGKAVKREGKERSGIREWWEGRKGKLRGMNGKREKDRRNN